MTHTAELRRVSLFAEIAEERLRELAAQAREMRLDAGEVLFADGDAAEHFYVLLSGEVQVVKISDAQETVLGTIAEGGHVGEPPLLLGVPYFATARALRESRVLAFSAAVFKRMLSEFPCFAHAVSRSFAQRIQNAEALLGQRQKLSALGNLAAGLAHELNNPAAAARRAAENLQEVLQEMQLRTAALSDGIGADQVIALMRVQQEIVNGNTRPTALDPLAQGDLEESLEEWLAEHDVAGGWELASRLAAAGVDTRKLDVVAAKASPETLAEVLAWLSTSLITADLTKQVARSATRISELVGAVKSYAYMDQAPLQEVDVNAALESTLSVLGYDLRDVELTRELGADIPRITANGGELNEVWTNLIENAVQAMGGRGRLWVRTYRDNDHVRVEIADDGPGIAPDIQPRIFEPFFTTKGVGEGTGLGLDFAYRTVVGQHRGDISFSSVPGDTCFQVRLPISQDGHPF